MLNEMSVQDRLLSSAVAALAASILVVFASLTHTVAAFAAYV